MSPYPNPYVKQLWVDAAAGVTGSSGSAARHNWMEQGIYDAHFRPCVRVSNTTGQSILNSTVTVLTFDTEQVDVDGLGGATMHDNVVNPSRLTCRVPGVYLITANVGWSAIAGGYRQLLLVANGTTGITDVVCGSIGAGARHDQVASAIIPLGTNDYVEAWVAQGSGSTELMSVVAGMIPALCMVKVA